ncbi:MAG: isoprenyl transferase [Gammaproteobacteria bacterium]
MTLNTDLPAHVAVVMDGNGRWAQARGLPRVQGHRKGVDAAREMTTLCARAGIAYLTLFAFSSENWRRPDEEVSFLKTLLMTSLQKEFKRLHANNIRLKVIGDPARFGSTLEAQVQEAESRTAQNTGLTLTIALNYGARWEIAEMTRALANECNEGILTVSDITESLISRRLSTADMPDPDLFIRTGGEIRLSNFLLWQLAYTELFFTDTLWPDFDETAFNGALEAYRSRRRRFGKTQEQVDESA